MAETIAVNVYQIGGATTEPVHKRGFPVSKIRFKAIQGIKTVNGVRVYSEIEEYPNGLSNSYRSYTVVETVDALNTAANA